MDDEFFIEAIVWRSGSSSIKDGADGGKLILDYPTTARPEIAKLMLCPEETVWRMRLYQDDAAKMYRGEGDDT